MKPDLRDPARSAPRKVMAHVLPFTFLIFVVSFLDRANISLAALTMRKSLALTSEGFGFASGVFFIGYMLCEVPSNAALRRFGARVWLARIQLTWGLVACLSAFVQSAAQLYLARFLLGVAEAGLVPGLIAYYNYWFRMDQLARTGAILGAAAPVSFIVSGPLSTWIMEHVSLFHLAGWRSMILLEGLPALATGAATYFVLADSPASAAWLTPAERDWLARRLDEESRRRPHLLSLGLRQTLANPRVVQLGLIYLLYQVGNFGIGFWMPQVLRSFGHGLSTMQVGLLSTVPYLAATAGLYAWSWSSDRSGERRWHAAAALALAALGLAGSALAHRLAPAMALLSLALTGFYAFKSPFNVLPRLFLDRDSATIAFAVINTVGQIGAFTGPFLFGLVAGQARGAVFGLFVLSGITAAAGAMIPFLRFDPAPPRPRALALELEPGA
jgi:ACS family tartrate transporter-like MFS transporter